MATRRAEVISLIVNAGRAAKRARERFRGQALLLTADLRDAREKTGVKGLPLREALQELFLVRRDKTFAEAVLFLLYGLVFAFVTYSIQNPPGAYEVNAALSDLFLDEEIPGAIYKKNFYEVMTQGELWDWLRGPLLTGAYPTTWYNGDAIEPNSTENDLLYVARRLGGVQLRQMRVAPDSCSGIQQLGPAYTSSDGECYGPFEEGETDSREAFGPGGKYEWSDGHHVLKGLTGYGPTYGTGGFVVELPRERENATARLEEMFADKWTDRQTRAVSVMFNVWNMQTRFLTVVQILFEIFPSGHIVHSYQLYSMKPALYETQGDNVRAVGELIILAGCIYYLWFEIKTLVVLRCRLGAYIQRASNVYEMLLQFFVIAVLAFYFRFLVAPERREFDSRDNQFIDFFTLANDYVFIFTLAAFIGLLQVLKLFRYFGIAKRMLALWYTLQMAFPDLVAFGVGYLMLNIGFAYMAVMLYGGNVPDFHTFTSSFSTLLRYPLGGTEVNYEDLVLVRPEVTPWFFLFFLTLILLVCFNILVAIIVIFYEDVSKMLRRADPWKRGLPSPDTRFIANLQTTIRQRFRGCRGCFGLCPQGRGADAEHKQVMAEQNFARLMQEFDDRCWSVNAIDVLEYFDKVFEARGRTSTVYISRRELEALAMPIDASSRGGAGACGRQACLGCMVAVETACKFVVGLLTCSVCSCGDSLTDEEGQALPRRNSEAAQRRPSMKLRIEESEQRQRSVLSRQARSQTGISVQGDPESLVEDLLRSYVRCKDVVLMGNVAENDDRLQSNTVLPDGFVVRNASYIGATAMEDATRAAEQLRAALVHAGQVASSALISTSAFNGGPEEDDGSGGMRRTVSAAALSAVAATAVTRFVVCRVSSRRAYAVRQLEVDARDIKHPMILVRRPDGQTTHRFPIERVAQIEASRVDTERAVLVLVGADEVKRSPGDDDEGGGASDRRAADGEDDEEVYGQVEKSLTFRFLPDDKDPSQSERETFIERLLIARVAALGGGDGGLIMQGMASQIVTGIVSTLAQRRNEVARSLPGTSPSVANPIHKGGEGVELSAASSGSSPKSA